MPKAKKEKKVAEKKIDELVISTGFELKQLMLKDQTWTAQILVKKILPKTFHDYGIKMIFDEKPYADRIERVKEQVANAKKEQKLFKEMSKADIDELEGDIKAIEKEKAEMKRQCLTIEFSAVVEQLKYDGGDTKLAIRLPDNVIEPLNKAKLTMNYYKIELEPLV
jgi:hypothetical protein